MKLSGHFEHKTRDNGEKFVSRADSMPDWLCEAIQAAHQEMLPDDWVYEECLAVCQAIDEDSVDADDVHSHCDSRVDVYTRDLYQWAADHCTTSLFSAAEEASDDLGTTGSIEDRLKSIQYCAILFIADTIVAAHGGRSPRGFNRDTRNDHMAYEVYDQTGVSHWPGVTDRDDVCEMVEARYATRQEAYSVAARLARICSAELGKSTPSWSVREVSEDS